VFRLIRRLLIAECRTVVRYMLWARTRSECARLKPGHHCRQGAVLGGFLQELRDRARLSSRMLKKSSGCVLASLRGSAYGPGKSCLGSSGRAGENSDDSP